MSASALQDLRAANRNLRARLHRLQDRPAASPSPVLNEITELRAELQCAQASLNSLITRAAEPALADEISQYRSHLHQLETVLPSVQTRLLIEKARLENARTHIAKATAWIQGSKEIL